MSAAVAPLLVLGWGNRSRGDDALAPLCVDALARRRAARRGADLIDADAIDADFIEAYQLMPEHALELRGRRAVLLVDAAVDAAAPFEVRRVAAAADARLDSHALSPAALLEVYRRIEGAAPPPCTLLAIAGRRFGLGEAPDADALAHLAAALDWADDWLRRGGRDAIRAWPGRRSTCRRARRRGCARGRG